VRFGRVEFAEQVVSGDAGLPAGEGGGDGQYPKVALGPEELGDFVPVDPGVLGDDDGRVVGGAGALGLESDVAADVRPAEPVAVAGEQADRGFVEPVSPIVVQAAGAAPVEGGNQLVGAPGPVSASSTR